MSETIEAKSASIGAWPRAAAANAVSGLATVVRKPRTTTTPAWRARFLAGALAAAAVTIVIMAFCDARVAAAAKIAPHWLVAAFAAVTDFGKSGWLLIPIAALLLAFDLFSPAVLGPISRLVLAAAAVRLGFLFAAIAVPGLLAALIKRMIGRARPFVADSIDPYLYAPFVWRSDHASMPSGHATTAFAAAVAFGLIWPWLRAPMLVYALMIVASRVVLGAHFASDVVAGAIVGSLGAILVRDWFAARRLGFTIDAGGRVQSLPGPSFARIKRVARRLIAP